MRSQFKNIAPFLALALTWLAASLSAQTAALSVLGSFAPYTDTGRNPQGALVQGSDGNFYGVTSGSYALDVGEVFKITPTGVITPLHLFTGADGAIPTCTLVEGSDGYYYGTTSEGGANGTGTVFSISSDGSTFKNTYSFAALTQGPGPNYSHTNSDGAVPNAGLVAGADGVFYGTTSEGGVNGYGTVFSITAAKVFTVLHTFAGSDGEYPNALVSGPGGFYGTTGGGLNNTGTIFRITASGAFTTLHTFTALNSQSENGDGAEPIALVLGTNGLFYGTTGYGGQGTKGTIFSMTSTGGFGIMHNFAANGSEGYNPNGLVEYGSIGFYGTTQSGGANGGGTVYRITPAGSFLTIYSFAPGGSQPPSMPLAALIKGSTGYLYGSTDQGGDSGGALFSITTGGTLTVLHYFIQTNSNGAEPLSGVTVGKNGLLYGTASKGGTNATGAIFSVAPDRIISAVNSAYGSVQGLLQISDANLYGTTTQGGTFHEGSVFKLQPDGVLITLYNFHAGYSSPNDRLIQSANGDLYGTTAPSPSTIFQLTLSGTFTTFYEFSGTDSGQDPNCLLIGKDGNFYGTTSQGSADGGGTIFQLTSAGALTYLHNFSAVTGQYLETNSGGSYPLGVIQATNGDFYGVTEEGGSWTNGTFFKVTASGQFAVLHSFGAGGEYIESPAGNVTEGTDGNFYLAVTEGSNGYGAIVQLTPAGAATILYSFTGGNDGGAPSGSLVESATAGTFYGTAGSEGENGTGTVYALTVSPAITSATTGSATGLQAYSYKVTATNTPTAFAETGLPAGLSINSKTGLISGTPTASGTFSINLTATNAGGSGTAVLKLTVAK
jgi:uncharacterized repeat protein (TIGR03803 family)